MAYTLAQAAIATGRDRSTLLKAIKSGKISAARDDAACDRRAVANLGHTIGGPGLRLVLRRLP